MNKEYRAWIDQYEMINPQKRTRCENGILFTLEYLLLLNQSDASTFEDSKSLFRNLVAQLKHTETPGMYDQTPFNMGADHGDEGEEPISHDNLTAISAGSYYFGDREVCKEIWSYLVRHLFTYDSRVPGKVSFKRIMHPRDIVFYGALAGNILCKMLIPVVMLAHYLTCKKDATHTSGKLLAFVRMVCYPSFIMKINKKLADKQMSEHYGTKGWFGVFEVYFGKPGHPTAALAKELFDETR